MLPAGRLLMTPMCLFIATTALAVKHHRERAAGAGAGGVWIGAVNCLAVVHREITGLQPGHRFEGFVVGAVVRDALRETKYTGTGMRPRAPVAVVGRESPFGHNPLYT